MRAPGEASGVFDPELLRPVLADLAAKAVPVVSGREAEALRGLTAVDGTFFRALPRMAWALWRDGLVSDRQALAVVPIIGGRSAEARTQIRALLAKQGVPPDDFARIGLPAG